MNNRRMRILGAALLVGVVASAALAGGPNSMYDEVNKVPNRWHLDRYPNQAVPVYTDLGGLGLMNNAQASDWVIRAWDQWNNVPSSKFKAQVIGNVTMIPGITGDITPANVAQIYPKFNGGGITVVYDYDGKIFRDYLGLGLNQVLGIAFTEYKAAGSDEILETTVFINGFMQWFNDTDGRGMSGIFTHEFGHAANLAHSQANGAVYNNQTRDYPTPFGCSANQPYPSGSGAGVTRQQIETMYPFINHQITGSSEFQFSVDRMDDIAALSDLYPEPGWPESYGTIKGTVRSLLNIRGNGTGDDREVTGVNVIARNVADPFNDFVSAVSGNLTRGFDGPDGEFELHGLTPGAQYVVYVDNLAAGAFPYPRMLTLPGPEEWYNAAGESGNGETDDRCSWTPVSVADHATTTVDFTFNRVKGAPSFTLMNFLGSPSAVTPDGSTMVGQSTNLDGFWLWSVDGGYQQIGGFARLGGLPGISDDGSKIAGTVKNASGVIEWGLYDRGTQTWNILPRTSTSVLCAGSFGPQVGTIWGISGDGSTVIGLSSNAAGCRAQYATKWTAAGGTVTLEKYPQADNRRASRANWTNYDGSVITGWDESPNRNGVYWVNGVEHFMGTPNQSTFVSEGVYITRDGTTVIGGGPYVSGNPLTPNGAYKHFTTNDSHEIIQQGPEGGSATAWRTNDAANVIGGFSRIGSETIPRIWTSELGWSELGAFMESQGVYAQGTLFGIVSGMSADGRVWVGSQATTAGSVVSRTEIPKAIVCHKAPGNPHGKSTNLDVAFPEGFADHLAHGDTVGLCQHGGE